MILCCYEQVMMYHILVTIRQFLILLVRKEDCYLSHISRDRWRQSDSLLNVY